MLFVGNMICGFPWGIFQTLTTTYAAEICPMAMRGYLTSWVSMCWGTGSFLAAGVLRASLGLPGNWGKSLLHVPLNSSLISSLESTIHASMDLARSPLLCRHVRSRVPLVPDSSW